MFVVCVHICIVCVAFILLLCHPTLYIYSLPIVSVCWIFLLCAVFVGLLFLSHTWLYGIICASCRLFHHLYFFHNFRDHFERMHLCLLCGIEVQGLIVSFSLCVFPHINSFLAINKLISTQLCNFLTNTLSLLTNRNWTYTSYLSIISYTHMIHHSHHLGGDTRRSNLV